MRQSPAVFTLTRYKNLRLLVIGACGVIATTAFCVGHTQPSIQSLTGTISLRVKWAGHKADHSCLFGTEVKNSLSLYWHFVIYIQGEVLSELQE
jgi:hypothetical protein